jgi:hypothetical protein
MARSVRYYVDVLRFTNADWGGDDFTCVTRDGAGIYLAQGDQGQPGTWVWIGVEDVGPLHEEYKLKGANVLQAPENHPADSGTPTEWLGTISRTIVNVHCECAPRLASTRFVKRTRHPGHLDATQSSAEVLSSIQALPMHAYLGVGEPMVIDTANAVDPALLLQDVEAAFARCRTRLAADGGR